MVQGAVSFVDRNGPAHGYAVLDRAHLTRITFNDPSLEQEVLQLFERQAELLMACIRKSAGRNRHACTHPQRIRSRYRC